MKDLSVVIGNIVTSF